jgi:putative oxidoreductase
MDSKHIAPVIRSAVEHAVEPVVKHARPVVHHAVGGAVERTVEHAVHRAVEHAVEPTVKRVRPAIRRRLRERHRRRWVTPFGPGAADASLLGLRLTFGGYMAGHGAQKLFGAFGGGGPKGTGEHFEQLGLKPGVVMSVLAGSTELFGGVLTATGTASPLGPIMSASTMAVAAGTAHRGKGAFGQTGGPELPLMDLAAAAVLAALGPGRFSVDRLTGTRLPAWMARAVIGTGIALSTGLVAWSIVQQRAAQQEATSDDAMQDQPVPARREPPPAVAHTG